MGSIWRIDPANKKIIKGGVEEPTCTFGMSDEDFMKLLSKESQAAELFMSGRMKLDGDMGEAMKFQSVMEGFGDLRKIASEIVSTLQWTMAENQSVNIGKLVYR